MGHLKQLKMERVPPSDPSETSITSVLGTLFLLHRSLSDPTGPPWKGIAAWELCVVVLTLPVIDLERLMVLTTL